MIALLGREFVNVPLLCGVAGHSRDASGPPTRGALGFSLGAAVFLPSHWDDLLSVKAQHPSVFVPLVSPAGSAPSVPGCVMLPAALYLSPPVWSMPWAPLSGPAAVVTPPPHCVLPETSARTRCRLMASSRNPATFSLSSSFMKA